MKAYFITRDYPKLSKGMIFMADSRKCCEESCSGRECPDTNFREAVCIHTDKIYDSCRDKDCLENIRVYLTERGQEIVDRAINVKCTKAEVIWVFSDINFLEYILLKIENTVNKLAVF